jgi:hypothetical protein
MDKIIASVQTLETTNISETYSYSSALSSTNLKSDMQKESEHATQKESV